MRAERRKFHYIYKITREDGKFYIGMHSTDHLEDGYFGSGMLLWKSIRKHGKEKHQKEILEFLPSRKELKERERQLVNEDLLGNVLCMNLKLGGEGGFAADVSAKGNAAQYLLMKDPMYRAKRLTQICEARDIGRARLLEKFPEGTWKGKSHSEETKQKMRKPKNIGEQNSQFGTCWIIKDDVSHKIPKSELDNYVALGFTQGRKIRVARHGS